MGQKEFSQQGVALKEPKIWVVSLCWMSDRMNIPVLIPPTGGMFDYVSGANFLGEITEWVGFALAGHSVHSAAFAIFTAVVLASRAVAHHKWEYQRTQQVFNLRQMAVITEENENSHSFFLLFFLPHRWYLAKFENYPKQRKALIPLLFWKDSGIWKPRKVLILWVAKNNIGALLKGTEEMHSLKSGSLKSSHAFMEKVEAVMRSCKDWNCSRSVQLLQHKENQIPLNNSLVP